MNYRYIGNSPTDLEGGRPIAPGGYTGDIDISPVEEGAVPDKNQQLLEEGLLVEAPDVELQDNLEPVPVEESEEVQEPAGEQKLTGQALDDRAKELDIEGRSEMSADELRTAIAEAESAEQNDGGDFS